jgi:hypothetical protein
MAFFTDSLRSAIAAVNPFNRGNVQTGVDRWFTPQLAIAAYLSSGMLRKVIKIPAADRVREWRDWQATKEQIETLEAEERRLGVVAKVKLAEVLRGIGGGALILAVPGDPATPVAANLSTGALAAVNVASRWQLQLVDIDENMASITYGQPRMFRINSGTKGQQDIHPSRVICFCGDPLPMGTGISAEDAFWGESRLESVFAEVQKSDNASQWFAELVKKAKLLRVGIPNLSDITATDDGQRRLEGRISLIATGESTLNATVFDAGDGEKGGEKLTDYQITWTGIPAMMDAFDQRVAAVADIPFTRLMGRSPAGMNATGESDQANWNKMVVAGQKLELRPCLDKLDAVLIPSAGVNPDEVTWRFAPLDTPSEEQEAGTFDKTMDAVTKLQATGSIPDQAFVKGVQNLMSEREWMPGLDQALAEIPEDERFGLAPSAELDDPSALQATRTPNGGKEADPDLAPGGDVGSVAARRRAANDKKLDADS